MSHAEDTPTLRRLLAKSLASLLAVLLAMPAYAAQTDISSTPIVTTTAALVKPNIMLLMDASDSMARTHMPDEVEFQTRPSSIGYKSAQCNVLYYNPATTYFLPKRSDGTAFPAPAFTNAPYAGYGNFYATPDTTTTDLSTSFVAYDARTVELSPPPIPDPAQAAYYYVYTGPQTLSFATAPCTDDDIRATTPASGGGTWTRVVVGAGERQNFANWYSFYRTRLSLIKSAASLAFSPLDQTKRVGFITVEPKDNKTDPAINPIRYLPIADFDSTQKGAWFDKLFSQTPKGLSPAREGLARVGRHYAGKQDSINNGMTGDPVQYACQQNFTILTTDGYWNGQSETPTSGGLFGGALALDGMTKVGQQDGDPTCPLSDPYCPRPIFDGIAGSVQKVTDKTNAYTDNVCSLASARYKTTFQTTRRQFTVLRDTTRQQRTTTQYKVRKSQVVAQTTQTTRTVTQTQQTTRQFALSKTQVTEERYQHVRSTEQTTRTSEQYQLQTIQLAKQTFQTRQVQRQTQQRLEQWSTSSSQYVVSKTQYVSEETQYRYGQNQQIRERFQIYRYDHSVGETGTAVSGPCTASPGDYPIECRQVTVESARLVDPATCVAGVGPGPEYIRTTCTPGSNFVPYGPVSFCSPGVTSPTAANGWTTTTCDLVVTSAAAPINGTCSPGSTQGPGPAYLITTCTQPAGPNNTSSGIASCTPGTTSSGSPDYITTSCTQPAATNFGLQPSPACAPGTSSSGAPNYITTTCAKTTDSTSFTTSCTNDPGTSPPYLKVSCSTATIGDVAVTPGSCTAGNGPGPGFIVTDCPRSPFGTYATLTPTDTCAGGTGPGPDFVETVCSNPAGSNNQTVFTTAAGCGTLGTTPGAAPDWITRICSRPPGANNQSGFSDPATCIADPGTAYPYLRVTCATNQLTPPTVVDPTTTCTSFGTFVGPAPDYIVTVCAKQAVSAPRPVGACTPGIGPGPSYIVTVCGTGNVLEPVASCTPGFVGNSGPPDFYDIYCVNPAGPNNATTNVYSCTPQAATAPQYVQVTCSGPTVVDSRPYDPAACFPGGGPGPDFFVVACNTAAAGAYPSPTPVASCTAGTDSGTLITTACTSPAANNFPDQDSAPCTVGTTTDASQVTTTCSVSTTTEWVPSCSPVTQVGTGPEVTCAAPVITLDEAVPSCAVGAVDGAPFFAMTTACRTDPPGPAVYSDYAGACTPDSGSAPGWVQTACGERTLATRVADSGCTLGRTTNTGTGVITDCFDEASGPGRKYTVQTTITVTTTPYSGTVAAGPGVTTTSSGAVTDVDGVCYPTVQSFPPRPPVDIAGCSAWPCTEVTVGTGGSENSLADVANYYYKTDLRPAMPDVVQPAGTGIEDDKAPHQHMTTFTLALGVSGTLKYRPDYRSLSTTVGDFADIRTGAKNWPVWPDPLVDYTNVNNYNNPKSIDDFWHTAVDGRGRYFSANNPRSVIQGLGDAFSAIDSRVASGAAEAVSSLEPIPGNNFAYATSYKSIVWSGDLQAFDIILATGGLSAAKWSASALLGARTFAACDNRDILVMRGSSALGEFKWNTDFCPSGVAGGGTVTTLSAAEQAFFGPLNISLLSQYPFMTDGTGGTVDQQTAAKDPGRLVNFLRGQRGNEDYESNSLTKLWRTRESVLGDIVDSQPVYVRAPFASYSDPGYSGFKSANALRTPMVYVGANDGMLHAFFATTDTTDPLRGKEAWAVIPSSVLPNMYKLADDNYKRAGHQFYVDGTPVAADVFDGSAWRTIIVGGLNAGGKGYYALDITNAGARPTPLWEFKQDATQCPGAPAGAVGNTGDCNLGLTYGKPVITKLASTWVVMVTSGYNNVNGASNGADGGGFLYVLNAISGAIIAKIPTETGGANVGTASTPSGLAQINNFVANTLIDNTTQRAYGTDVIGNVWRFDFSPYSATLVGTARDSANNPQPITTRPELAELDGKPFIMVGTGKFLGATDVTDTRTQSVYGFTDPLNAANPVYANLRNALRPLAMTQVGTGTTAVRTVACSVTGAPCTRTAGWVVDLAEAGERVNVEMKLVLGTLAVASNVPNAIPCSVGGHSWFNLFDFRTGLAVTTAPNSIVGNPTSDRIVSTYLADSLNVGFNVVRLPPATGQNNGRFDAAGRQSDASRVRPPFWVADPPPVGKRISWREIAQ